MSKKLEKLREINETISVIINDLETYIFIENIDNVNNKKKIITNRTTSKTLTEIKK